MRIDNGKRDGARGDEKRHPAGCLFRLISFCLLQFDDIGSLGSTSAVDDFEGNLLAVFESFVAFALDCRVMSEDVFSVFTSDESITFFCVKPLDRAVHLFLCFSLFLFLMLNTLYILTFGIASIIFWNRQSVSRAQSDDSERSSMRGASGARSAGISTFLICPNLFEIF